jgi:hypothetical protein
MCHIEVVMLEPCDCQLFPYEPEYCKDYENAHPEVQPPWTPTILCDGPFEIGDLDILKDGIRFQILSKKTNDDLQFFDCKTKEYSGMAIGDCCVYHEHLKLVEGERQAEKVVLASERASDVIMRQHSDFNDFWDEQGGVERGDWKPALKSNKQAEEVAKKRKTKVLAYPPNVYNDLANKAEMKKTEENSAIDAASLLEASRKKSEDLTLSDVIKRADRFMQRRRLQRRGSGLGDVLMMSGPPTPPAQEPKTKFSTLKMDQIGSEKR